MVMEIREIYVNAHFDVNAKVINVSCMLSAFYSGLPPNQY